MHASRILNKNAYFYADSIAVIDGERRLTYKELDNRVRRLVNALKNRGMAKGDKIAILAYNCLEYQECMLACERGGYVCVPLNWRLNPANIAYILNNSDSKALIVQDRFLNVIFSIKENLSCTKSIMMFGQFGNLPAWIDYYEDALNSVHPDDLTNQALDEDLAYIIYSSGTTGLPKGIMYNHRMQFEASKVFIQGLGLKRNDISLNVMPLFHSGGHTMASAVSYIGGTNIMFEKFEAKKVLETINKEKVTVIHLVPTMLASLLEVPNIEEYNLSSLKTIHYAASPISLTLLRKAMSIFGQDRFIQMYGLTENGPAVSVLNREAHIEGSGESASDAARKRLESVGLPLFNAEIKIVDQEDKILAPGMIGEIVVRSESTTTGYWKQPDLTAEKLRDGWLYTGDMGKLEPDGYLYLVDRKNDMIISGGENIYPNEVEIVLCSHPAVKEAAVIGLPDEKWGEVVVAAVSFWQGMKASEEELVQYCRERIDSYKKPKRIICMDTLPKSPSGKILRRLVREQLFN